MEKQTIVKASRCIFPGGRFVLMGYNAEGREVFGLGHKAKNASSGIRWARSGSPEQDLAKVKKAYDEWHAQAAAEAATSDATPPKELTGTE